MRRLGKILFHFGLPPDPPRGGRNSFGKSFIFISCCKSFGISLLSNLVREISIGRVSSKPVSRYKILGPPLGGQGASAGCQNNFLKFTTLKFTTSTPSDSNISCIKVEEGNAFRPESSPFELSTR